MLRGFYYAKLRAAVWTAVSGLLTRISELRPRQALSAARSPRRASTHGRPAVFRSRSVLRSACESRARVSDDVLTQFAHIDVRSEVREDDCNAREAILLGCLSIVEEGDVRVGGGCTKPAVGASAVIRPWKRPTSGRVNCWLIRGSSSLTSYAARRVLRRPRVPHAFAGRQADTHVH